jgi:hypothetical protein
MMKVLKKAVVYIPSLVLALVLTLMLTSIFTADINAITNNFLSIASETPIEAEEFVESNIFEEALDTDILSADDILNAGDTYGSARGLYGKIIAKKANLNMGLYIGDMKFMYRGALIENGVLPDQAGLTRISGHNTILGVKINKLDVGDTFEIRGPSRDFTFRIYDKGIVNFDDTNVFVTPIPLEPPKTKEILLYNCWPLDAEETDQREYFKAVEVE